MQPPVNLHGLSGMEFQGDISLGSGPSKVAHGSTDRTLAAGKAAFFDQPIVDASGCMVLFGIPLLRIFEEALLDELDDIWCHDTGITMVIGA